MKWIVYFAITVIVYIIVVTKLKVKTQREKVKEASIFWNTLIFLMVFELVFIDSIFSNFLLHILGLFLSFIYSLSIYIYLKSLRKDVETIFYDLLEQSQGIMSILTFMQATELSSHEAQEYLNKTLKELRGNRHSTRGNIYYEFNTW